MRETFSDVLSKIAKEEEIARNQKAALHGILDLLTCGAAVFLPVGEAWTTEFNQRLPHYVTSLPIRTSSPADWLDSLGAFLVTGRAAGKSLFFSALSENRPHTAEVMVEAAGKTPHLVLTVIPLNLEDSKGAVVLVRYANAPCPCGINCAINKELLP